MEEHLSQSSFLLTKWYLDCVTEEGDTVVLYLADLRWNALRLHYASLLTLIGGAVAAKCSLRRYWPPQLSREALAVDLPSLNLAGRWSAQRPPFRRTLFETKHGFVDWNCLQPMSHVEVVVCNKTRFGGLGYAECLSISVLPWKLPLNELHWGRFTSNRDSVVWIDWRGPHEQQIVLHNGQEEHAKSITESEIVLANGDTRVDLNRDVVLRSGRLGDTVFRGVSRLAKLLPQTMLSVEERKWRSGGRIHTPEGGSLGWAIHEVVKWKR